MFKQLQNLLVSCETPNKRTLSFERKVPYEERFGPLPKVDLPEGSMLEEEWTAEDEQGSYFLDVNPYRTN